MLIFRAILDSLPDPSFRDLAWHKQVEQYRIPPELTYVRQWLQAESIQLELALETLSMAWALGATLQEQETA